MRGRDEDWSIQQLQNMSAMERQLSSFKLLTYLVNCVNNAVLDDGITGQNTRSADEDVGALNGDSYGRAGKRLVRIAMPEVGCEDGESNNEMSLENLGENMLLNVRGDRAVVRSQEGDASARVKVAEEPRPVQRVEGLVGTQVWESE